MPSTVVITGISNPGLDGNGLCKALRERHNDRVKVIAEFDRVLSKPFSIDALCTAIDALTIGTVPVMHE